MFSLPKLPYAEDALSPFMSRDTLHTHHAKHHAGYLKKMNAALEKMRWNPASVEEVIARAKKDGDKFLFNQSAQVWNHTFFWNCMTPSYAAPEHGLAAAIDESFGGLDEFKRAFIEKGEKHFGSGYVWLLAGGAGKIELTDKHDAETPAIDEGVTPLLCCDVWEHAYYLDHKNDRAAFLEVFFDKLANWKFAAQQFSAARGDGARWAHPKAEKAAA